MFENKETYKEIKELLEKIKAGKKLPRDDVDILNEELWDYTFKILLQAEIRINQKQWPPSFDVRPIDQGLTNAENILNILLSMVFTNDEELQKKILIAICDIIPVSQEACNSLILFLENYVLEDQGESISPKVLDSLRETVIKPALEKLRMPQKTTRITTTTKTPLETMGGVPIEPQTQPPQTTQNPPQQQPFPQDSPITSHTDIPSKYLLSHGNEDPDNDEVGIQNREESSSSEDEDNPRCPYIRNK